MSSEGDRGARNSEASDLERFEASARAKWLDARASSKGAAPISAKKPSLSVVSERAVQAVSRAWAKTMNALSAVRYLSWVLNWIGY